MIIHKRKGKNKHIVLFTPAQDDQEHEPVRAWCTEHFGPGGRNKQYRWRYGWTDITNVYYFKHEKDLTMFMLRWA